MTAAILCCTSVLLLWALFADRLRRLRVTAPMIMVLGGIAVGVASGAGIGPVDLDLQVAETVLAHPQAQKIAEVILALVLFVDSFEIRRGILGHEPRPVLRLLFLALPLSIVLAVVVGAWTFPAMDVIALLALACAVAPTDFAPAAAILKDERLPERVRNLLNVESGYNDGIVAPVFIFALTLAGNTSHASTPAQALEEALPASLKAIAVGVAVGALGGWAMRGAVHRGLTSSAALRVGVVALPLITYAAAMLWHGNGFVAAFVAGLAFRAARGEIAHHEVELTEDVATLASDVMWLVLGILSVVTVSVLFSWRVLVFSLAALTVVRIVPVLLALLGSRVPWRDRMLVALLGPRGIATIVFCLLAFADLPVAQDDAVLPAMVLVVLGSFVLHGLGAPLVASLYARRHPVVDGSAPTGH